jgi:intracellular septation protein A
LNYRILASGIPVGVFYLLTRVADPWVAVAGGFVASAIVFWYNRRDRLIGALTGFSFLVVFVSALIGIIFNNEKAYLAAGPVGDFLFVALYLGSIAIRKPIIGGIVRELMPKYAGHVPMNAPVFYWLTIAWAIWDLLHGVIRLWMLGEMSIGEYIIWSRLAFWPFSTAMIGGTAWFAIREGRRRLPPEEQDDLPTRPRLPVLTPLD